MAKETLKISDAESFDIFEDLDAAHQANAVVCWERDVRNRERYLAKKEAHGTSQKAWAEAVSESRGNRHYRKGGHRTPTTASTLLQNILGPVTFPTIPSDEAERDCYIAVRSGNLQKRLKERIVADAVIPSQCHDKAVVARESLRKADEKKVIAEKHGGASKALRSDPTILSIQLLAQSAKLWEQVHGDDMSGWENNVKTILADLASARATRKAPKVAVTTALTNIGIVPEPVVPKAPEACPVGPVAA